MGGRRQGTKPLRSGASSRDDVRRARYPARALQSQAWQGLGGLRPLPPGRAVAHRCPPILACKTGLPSEQQKVRFGRCLGSSWAPQMNQNRHREDRSDHLATHKGSKASPKVVPEKVPKINSKSTLKFDHFGRSKTIESV